MKELLSIYPNKFKVIKSLDEIVEDCNIYYVNENIPDDLVQPLTMWIYDVLEKRECPPAGFKNASISYVDFCINYGYDIKKLNYKLGMCLAKEEYYYSNSVNPIRFRNGICGEERILLWGQEIIKTPSLPSAYDGSTIDTLSVIMNVILVCLKTDVEHLKKYIDMLRSCRLLLDGDVIDNIICLKPRLCGLYYTQLEMNKDMLKGVLNSLMKLYTTYNTLEDLQIPSRLLCETETEHIQIPSRLLCENKNTKTVEDYENEYMNFPLPKFEEEISRIIEDYSKEESIKAIIGLTRSMEDTIKEQSFIKGE